MYKNTFLKLIETWYLHLIFIILAVIAVYYHTLSVPFYLDDFSSIQENPIIYNWQGTFKELWQFAALRIVGYFSFALNYQIHQFQYEGYHIVNIVIHILTGFAVFGLIRGLVQTPALRDVLSDKTKIWLPIIIALIFVLHPLQIQAVTYIVQRLAAMAALFYIAAMASFIQARLAEKNLSRILWTMACITFALLGFFTKQNTATLPIALLLLELIFFPGHLKRLLLATIISISGLIFVWVILAVVFNQNPFSLEAMEALTKETTKISRESYLATQFSVLWTYIKLFFYPVGLHIDYYYPITENLFNKYTLLALFGHLIAIGIAIFSLRRLPLLAFGILFYYLAHAVESSVIPITDVIFEHRTYLPNLGLMMLCGWLLVDRFPVWLNKFSTLMIITALIITLGTMTWFRNEQWREPTVLWQDNVAQSPEKKRAWVILGKHLIQAHRPKEGIEALKNAVEVRENSDGTVSKSYTLENILNMVVAYKMLKEYDTALSWIDQALQQKTMKPFYRAKFLVNRGNIFYEHRQFNEAESSYRQAIKLNPQSLIARANLASILAATGRFQEAEDMYLAILHIDPNNRVVQDNLGKVRKLMQQ